MGAWAQTGHVIAADLLGEPFPWDSADHCEVPMNPGRKAAFAQTDDFPCFLTC